MFLVQRLAGPTASISTFAASASLLLRLSEISQIRRRLVLSRRHQVAVFTHPIDLRADAKEWNSLVADILGPVRQWIEGAPVVLHHRPWTGQCMVGHGDFVMQEVSIGLVEVDALLDDGLIVLVQRDAAAVEDTRSLQVAGFGFEHVIAAVPILVDPPSDGIAGEGRRNRLRPGASVREYPAMAFVDVVDQDVGGL